MKLAWALLELVGALTWAGLSLGWMMIQCLVMFPLVIAIMGLMILTALVLIMVQGCGVTRAGVWLDDVGAAGPWILDLLWGPVRRKSDSDE